MSHYMEQLYCRNCETKTDHYCHDDTPTRHRYTVTCNVCGCKAAENIADYKIEEVIAFLKETK